MTSLTQAVAKNTFVQVAGRFLSLIFGVWTISLVMRYFGPEQYGYYSISLAFLQVVGIIVDFGLYLITLKYLGEIDGEINLSPLERQQRSSAVMQNIFTIRFFQGYFFMA